MATHDRSRKTRREELQDFAYERALFHVEQMLLYEPQPNMTKEEVAEALIRIEKERINAGYRRPDTITVH